MKSVVSFTTAILALVFYDASETGASCTIGSKGSIFLPYQHHTLVGHSILSQSGIIRIQCMMLCWRHIHCMSFNHNDINGICQLNDASKEEFPESYKQGFSYFGGSSNKAKLLPEDRITTVATELSTPILQATSVQAVCNMTRLGMESGAIADHQITAKNVLNGDYAKYGPELARLNGNSSWCGVPAADTPWLQVDFLHTVDIYYLIVQKRPDEAFYVMDFFLLSSDDGTEWTHIKDANGINRNYHTGPDGHEVRVPVETDSQTMIRTRFIRIETFGFIGNPCMRVEFICN